MKKLIYILLLPILVFFGYTFHMKNPQVVDINYPGIEWSGSLSILLIAAILIGIVLGSIAMAFYSIKAKAQARSVRKKLEKVEKEVENLRALIWLMINQIKQ